MIDARAARAEPDEYRRRLARKGAAEAFDAWLAADARWRDARATRRRAPLADEGQGQADARAARGAPQREGGAAAGRAGAGRSRGRTRRHQPAHPESACRRRPRRRDRGRRRGLRGRRRATAAREPEGKHSSSAASTWSARPGSADPASATGSATPACSRSRSTATHSTVSPTRGSSRVLPPVLVREEALIGTGAFPSDEQNVYASRRTASTCPVPQRSRSPAFTSVRSSRRKRCHSGMSPSRRAFAARRAPPERTRAACSASTSSTRSSSSRLRCPTQSRDEHELPARDQGGARRGARRSLPRRRAPAGDLGASAKKYDVEVWFPSQDRYRELTSVSNTTDFQARRLGIRYRDGKSLEPLHMLNGTAVDRPNGARDPRELPGRRAGRAARVRRTGARYSLASHSFASRF